MKVLMLCEGMDVGGCETHVYELILALKEFRNEVTLVCEGGRFAELLENAGVRIIRLPTKRRDPLSLFRTAFALRRLALIVDNKETLKELSHCKEMGASFLENAALAIVVMADPLASDVWIEDSAIASLMIQLQAEDLGLGSCWIQVRERFTSDGKPSNEFVHDVLDIPLQLQVLSIVAIGHKGMERKPFDEEHLQWEKIHINKYGEQ